MADVIALVTGASSGIGLATATALSRHGAAVAILCRTPDRAIQARGQIEECSGQPCHAVFNADLSSQDEVRTVAAEITKSLPQLDVLVNNAGAIFSERTLSPDGIEM